MRLNKIRDALLTVTDDVFHYEAIGKKDKYIVWAEDSEGDSSHADNSKKIQVIQGGIDYFTKDEDDPNAENIQTALRVARISHFLNSVQYEEETGYIHYEWIWEV